MIVLGGVALPFLTSASLGSAIDPWLRVSASLVSLIVAACAALEALYGWGAIWLEKRRAAELLKGEGWLLLSGGGRYGGRAEADGFTDFVTEVESQIAAEVGEYVTVAQSAQTRTGKDALPAPAAPDATSQPMSPPGRTG